VLMCGVDGLCSIFKMELRFGITTFKMELRFGIAFLRYAQPTHSEAAMKFLFVHSMGRRAFLATCRAHIRESRELTKVGWRFLNKVKWMYVFDHAFSVAPF